MKIRAVKDLARDRIEKRLGALGLLVVDEQRDLVALDLLPAGVIDPVASVVAL